ncbi:MAG TPA: alpha/beta fold hydrolase, partial [Candidatus Thermoplasmatota archaeon]
HDFIRERDLRRLAIVGHSLGGGVALLVALRLLDDGEDRLERLVAVGGVAYRQTIPFYVDVLRRLPRAGFLFGLLPAPWLIRRVLESIFHDPSQVTTEQVEGYSRPLTTPDARDALVTCARQLLPRDLDEIVARFPEIDVPALLLWGRQDRVVPLSVAERLARELPRARLAVLEGCGHVPPEEKPEESLRIVAAFLAEARRESGTSPHAGTGG